MRDSFQTGRFSEEEIGRKGCDKDHPIVRESSHIIEYDQSHDSRSHRDPAYRRDEVSYFSGDSQVHRREETSYPRAIVRHTEYCSDAEKDFTKPYRPATFFDISKFIPCFVTAPFPVNVKIPTTLGKYNGMSDPSDHLLNFMAVGGVNGWTLPYWCHMLALTFTRAAREWFKKLPDG